MIRPLNTRLELEFYLKLSDTMMETVPDKLDKRIITSWIRNLSSYSTSPDKKNRCAIKLEYLKVLYFLISKKCLIGPFSLLIHPNQQLVQLPRDYQLRCIEKNFLEKKYVYEMKRSESVYMKKCPCAVSYSSDLKQYAATQEIPSFGIHTYFSVSPEAVTNWNNFESLQLPLNILNTNRKFLYTTKSLVNCSCLVCNCAESRPNDQPGDDLKTCGKENSHRKDEIGLKHTSFARDYEYMIDRIPPIWGSNLLKTLNEPAKRTVKFGLKESHVDKTPSILIQKREYDTSSQKTSLRGIERKDAMQEEGSTRIEDGLKEVDERSCGQRPAARNISKTFILGQAVSKQKQISKSVTGETIIFTKHNISEKSLLEKSTCKENVFSTEGMTTNERVVSKMFVLGRHTVPRQTVTRKIKTKGRKRRIDKNDSKTNIFGKDMDKTCTIPSEIFMSNNSSSRTSLDELYINQNKTISDVTTYKKTERVVNEVSERCYRHRHRHDQNQTELSLWVDGQPFQDGSCSGQLLTEVCSGQSLNVLTIETSSRHRCDDPLHSYVNDPSTSRCADDFPREHTESNRPTRHTDPVSFPKNFYFYERPQTYKNADEKLPRKQSHYLNETSTNYQTDMHSQTSMKYPKSSSRKQSRSFMIEVSSQTFVDESPELDISTRSFHKKHQKHLETRIDRNINKTKTLLKRLTESPSGQAESTAKIGRKKGGSDVLIRGDQTSKRNERCHRTLSSFLIEEQFSLSSDSSTCDEQEIKEIKRKIDKIQQKIFKKLNGKRDDSTNSTNQKKNRKISYARSRNEKR